VGARQACWMARCAISTLLPTVNCARLILSLILRLRATPGIRLPFLGLTGKRGCYHNFPFGQSPVQDRALAFLCARMPLSKHKKHHAPAPISFPVLKARIDKAVAEGRFQQALELARQLHKQQPSPESLELLKMVSLGRVRQLHDQKYDRDALTMLDA